MSTTTIQSHEWLAGILILVSEILLGCGLISSPLTKNLNMVSINEAYRPNFHFTPIENWMNDPNGLVYYDGEYHLFYQHNPYDTVWGLMHWGHAISPDLVNWEHHPIALYPDENGAIFSGSAVVDWNNTAGFGEKTLVAIFTHYSETARQSQSLAYSTDKGRTWTKYGGNPILDPPENINNFRDPKVFWYGDTESNHWVMAVAAGNAILFFSSPDLKTWEPTGGFGFGYGSTEGVWETPDLFELTVDGGSETRWVLSVGVGDGGPTGGNGVQYFIGNFDGENFTSENPKDKVMWVDFGADFYAAQSWNDEPDGRRLWIGWMNNWRYATTIPTSTWRGTMTVPRELSLISTEEGIRLIQTPVSELHVLRDDHQNWKNQVISEEMEFPLTDITFELIAEFQDFSDMQADSLEFQICSEKCEPFSIGYAIKSHMLFIKRSECSHKEFHPAFSAIHLAAMEPENGVIRLRILLDRSSVEVFGNDGQIVLSDQIFPCKENDTLKIFANGGEVTLNSLDIYGLEPANFYLSEDANDKK